MATISLQVSDDGLRREVHSGFAPVLWYEVARPQQDPPVVSSYDFALIALLPQAMCDGVSLDASWPVDATLLDGLDHYQDVLLAWRPDIFRRKIDIRAEELVPSAIARPPVAVASFSGGVDSTFSLLRHREKLAGRSSRDLRSAVMVHGLDMPLEREDGFKALRQAGEATTTELGIEYYAMRTNWRSACPDWEMTFGVALVSVLHQFSATHDIGLIASEESYANSLLIWGSNPLIERFFSGGAFRIEYDGGATDRLDRIALLATRPSLIPNLRVCWAGPRTGQNCGVCPKCTLLMLGLTLAGVDQGWPFDSRLSANQVRAMPIVNKWQLGLLESISARFTARGDDGEISKAVAYRVRRGISNPSVAARVRNRLAGAGRTLLTKTG